MAVFKYAGQIVENIDASYAQTLHKQGLKPYDFAI